MELPPEVAAIVDHHTQQYGEQLMQAFLVMDEDADGRVDLRSAVMTLMKRGYGRPGGPVPASHEERGNADRYRRAHADNDKEFIKRIEKDDAGLVGVEEMVAACRAALVEYVGRLVPLDTDHDGNITLAEYAVSFPIREDQEVDAEGFTEQQRAGFARQDVNHDGVIAGEEWVAYMLPYFQNWIDTVRLTVVADQLDTDGDGDVSRAELQVALPDDSYLPEKLPVAEARYWIREMHAEARVELAAGMLPAGERNFGPTLQWSDMVAAYYGNTLVVRYRAAMFGSTLVVEATHTDGWRSYAMDNVERAEAVWGSDAINERPTQIELSPDVVPAAQWHQTEPADFSKPEIEWATWGFKGKAYFTRELAEWPADGFSLSINAQVCNADACAMADNLVINVPPEANPNLPPVGPTIEAFASLH